MPIAISFGCVVVVGEVVDKMQSNNQIRITTICINEMKNTYIYKKRRRKKCTQTALVNCKTTTTATTTQKDATNANTNQIKSIYL